MSDRDEFKAGQKLKTKALRADISMALDRRIEVLAARTGWKRQHIVRLALIDILNKHAIPFNCDDQAKNIEKQKGKGTSMIEGDGETPRKRRIRSRRKSSGALEKFKARNGGLA